MGQVRPITKTWEMLLEVRPLTSWRKKQDSAGHWEMQVERGNNGRRAGGREIRRPGMFSNQRVREHQQELPTPLCRSSEENSCRRLARPYETHLEEWPRSTSQSPPAALLHLVLLHPAQTPTPNQVHFGDVTAMPRRCLDIATKGCCGSFLSSGNWSCLAGNRLFLLCCTARHLITTSHPEMQGGSK